MKKILVLGLVILFTCVIHSQTHIFDVNKACKTLTDKAETSSKCCCAWYVMRAMHSGGCYIGIYPAWMYEYVIPYYNFKKVSLDTYKPQKGDIVVIENSEEHFWGHIAMYNGKQWISDFKQKNINPYKKKYKMTIFRYTYN